MFCGYVLSQVLVGIALERRSNNILSSDCSDQPVFMHNLTSAFTPHIHIVWIVKVETKISISIQAGRLNLRRLCAYAIGRSTKLACADLVTYRAIGHWLGHMHAYKGC